jgi:hypothetical protein
VLRQGKVIERGTHDDRMSDTAGCYAQIQNLQDGFNALLAAPNDKALRVSAATALDSAPASAAVAVPMLTANGRAHATPAPPRLLSEDDRSSALAVAMPVESITGYRSTMLGEILVPLGEWVTAAGNQLLALDDPGAVWRVMDGHVDVFYLNMESDLGPVLGWRQGRPVRRIRTTDRRAGTIPGSRPQADAGASIRVLTRSSDESDGG